MKAWEDCPACLNAIKTTFEDPLTEDLYEEVAEEELANWDDFSDLDDDFA